MAFRKPVDYIVTPGSPTYRRIRRFDPKTGKWVWVWAQTS